MSEVAIVVAPTVTKLPVGCAGAVLVTGSHGGAYPGRIVVGANLRAAIFHDAGIGREDAGIASLAILEETGIAAASVSHLSARIGDTDDMMRRGKISRANRAALAAGVTAGMDCAEAAQRLRGAAWRIGWVTAGEEARIVRTGSIRPVVLIDSASLADAMADAGAVIVTGSHGGLVGGDPAMALRADGFAAAYNDAGIGIDGAGCTRLPALEARGIAAITVAAASARIGEARSTFEDGLISAANATAIRLGAGVGMRARDVLGAWSNGGLGWP
jgi:hypothetical protein